MSSLRPAYTYSPCASTVYLSPVRVHSPWKVARDRSRRAQYSSAALGPRTHSSPISPGPASAPDSPTGGPDNRARPGRWSPMHVSGAVRQEDMQHLGRVQAVDDLAAEMGGETLADVPRQPSPPTSTAAAALRARRKVRRGQHARITSRRPEEHRHAASGPALEHRRRRRAPRHQHRRRPDAERKGQRIAEAIREEQLGRREQHVVLAQPEHRLAVQRRGPVQAGVVMHGPLGPPGRARRIQPEGELVGQRIGRVGQRRGREQLRERQRARARGPARDHHRQLRPIRQRGADGRHRPPRPARRGRGCAPAYASRRWSAGY